MICGGFRRQPRCVMGRWRSTPEGKEMLRSLTTIVAASAIAVVAAAPPLFAQEIPGGHSTAEVAPAVRAELLRRSIVREAARSTPGLVRAASARLQSQPPQRSWIGRHTVLTGALVGAGAGAVWAEIFCRGQCEGDPRLYIAFFGGAGAGIGAGVGAAIVAIRR